jgi:hypothetical protein
MRPDAVVGGNIVFRGNVFGPQTVRCTYTGLHGGTTWSSTNTWETTGLTANKPGG